MDCGGLCWDQPRYKRRHVYQVQKYSVYRKIIRALPGPPPMMPRSMIVANPDRVSPSEQTRDCIAQVSNDTNKPDFDREIC